MVHGVTQKQVTHGTAGAEHTNVAPEQTRLRGLFFSWRHTVCALEGVDSCRTPDSSWESTEL